MARLPLCWVRAFSDVDTDTFDEIKAKGSAVICCECPLWKDCHRATPSWRKNGTTLNARSFLLIFTCIYDSKFDEVPPEVSSIVGNETDSIGFDGFAA